VVLHRLRPQDLALPDTLGIGPGIANRNSYVYRSPVGRRGIDFNARARSCSGTWMDLTHNSFFPCRALNSGQLQTGI